jgi:hypothetical protein
MKKFILLSVICIFGSFSYAQTTIEKTTPKTINTQTTTVTTDKSALREVEKSIDRRLAYFNRYKQIGDIDNLTGLISQTNTDFYADFVNYLKYSHVFTLKRNTEEKITQSKQDTYIVSTIMTL